MDARKAISVLALLASGLFAGCGGSGVKAATTSSTGAPAVTTPTTGTGTGSSSGSGTGSTGSGSGGSTTGGSGTGTTSSPALPTPPPNATIYADVQKLSGWESCTVCAGTNGDGPAAPFTMTQMVTSPSLSGSAAQFWIGGTTPYSDALWWKQLGANPNASNFIYDLWFYVADPNAPQALEFDVNQSLNGQKFIFGTQCSYRGSGQWDVWDTANAHWVSTSIACNAVQANTWNHLTWYFQRNGNQTVFQALTLNDVTSTVNRSFNAEPSSAKELNVAFQMDGNFAQTNYSVWLDKVTLTAW